MGAINDNSISTLLYPFFKNILKIKIIITDQLVDTSWSYNIDILKKGIVAIKKIRNSLVDPKIIDSDIQDSEFFKTLKNIYEDFALIYLNRESLNCFSNGFLNLYLLKRQ